MDHLPDKCSGFSRSSSSSSLHARLQSSRPRLARRVARATAQDHCYSGAVLGPRNTPERNTLYLSWECVWSNSVNHNWGWGSCGAAPVPVAPVCMPYIYILYAVRRSLRSTATGLLYYVVPLRVCPLAPIVYVLYAFATLHQPQSDFTTQGSLSMGPDGASCPQPRRRPRSWVKMMRYAACVLEIRGPSLHLAE